MPELDIQINPFMADALVQMIETISSNLDDVLPADSAIPASDPDFQSIWVEGLREIQERDCSVLLHILRHRDFGRDAIPFDEETGEALLRSCSAIRLKIQDTILKAVAPEQLEVAQLNVQKLEPEQQRGYACYLFLATLQSLVIRELYPDLEDL
jgi:hypothetical protein